MALALDASTPAQAVTTGTAPALTATTASFTAPNNSVLIASAYAAGPNAAATQSWVVSDTGSLTWTLINSRDVSEGNSGGVTHYWAKTTSAASRTVSVQATSSLGDTWDVVLDLRVWTGANLADPIGAIGEGSSTSNEITPSAFTSEAASSILIAAVQDWNALGVPSSSDLTASTYDRAGIYSGLSGYKLLGAAGAQTFNYNSFGAGSPLLNWCAFELLAEPTSAVLAWIVA